jgi:hypothetical protein
MRAFSLIGRVAASACLLVILESLLAACGMSAGPGAPQKTASVTNTTPNTSINGCPIKQPPSNTAAHPADVVVGPPSSMHEQVTVQQGRTLEIRLRPQFRWSLSTQDRAHSLTSAQPNGWYDASLQVCVWRFTAVASGTADLTYTGTAVCQGGAPCPQFAINEDFTVTVA